MTKIQTNGLYFEVETFGLAKNPAILLVRGLGSQLIHWPRSLITSLVDQGLYVIAFDNRDSGLSQKIDDTNNTQPSKYSIRDMAQDCVDILDALAVAKAHVLGISMGGMITLDLMASMPERLISATIIMSSNGDTDLSPRGSQNALYFEAPISSSSNAPMLDDLVAADKLWEGPKFSIDDTARRDLILRSFNRNYFPAGVKRQFDAIKDFNRSRSDLAECAVATLIVHGSADQIFSVDHAQRISDILQTSELVVIDGMGHELTEKLGVIIGEKVVNWLSTPPSITTQATS